MDGSTGGSIPPNPDELNEVASAATAGSVANAGSTSATPTLPTSLPSDLSNFSPEQVAAAQAQAGQNQAQPRAVGSLTEELVTRPLEDIKSEAASFFSLSRLLGIENPQDSPEEKAKKQQLLQKFNQLSAEDQAAADQHYQEQMARKQQQEQEDMYRKQAEQASKANSFVMPSSPQRGAPDQSGQSKSQQAMQQLKQDRTTIGKLQTAG